MSRLLLCTDLDRTLLPNGSQPESDGAREAFARLAAAKGVELVYVTGRDPTRVDEAIERWNLPAPDALIADVGATVAERDGKRWLRRADWDERLGRDWGGRSGDDLAELLTGLPDLERQEASRQGRFKLSYLTSPGVKGRFVARAVNDRLDAAGVRASVIWSRDEVAKEGLLDILPRGADKAQAIEFVAVDRGFSHGEILFAGDSGNDLIPLTGPWPAVLVANATADVYREVVRRAAATGREKLLYCASGGKRGWNGNYAAGILEGVLHFHPSWRETIGD